MPGSAATTPLPPPSSPPLASTPPSTSTAHHPHNHHKMLFSVYKSKSKTREHGPGPLEMPDYDADLFSKDKLKQKEAVRRYLAEHIRNDWEFEWPPKEHDAKLEDVTAAEKGNGCEKEGQCVPEQGGSSETAVPSLPEDAPETNERGGDTDAKEDSGNEADSDSDVASIYSTISSDSAHYRARLEWTSDLSDDEPLPSSPYRFESPDSVGAAIRAGTQAKKDQRRRAIRDEAKWNSGLACFESRRNAWTQARIVRVKQKPASPKETLSPLSPRRFFFRGSFSLPGSPTTTTIPTSPSTQGQAQAAPHGHRHQLSGDASNTLSDSSDPMSMTSKTTKSTTPPPTPCPVEILLPLAPPLLPPANPMRAGITPAVYLPLYDKLVINGLAPSCPVNLQDMLRACVCGWKRDGEWPPRPTMVDPLPGTRKRRKRYEGRESGSIGGSIGRRMSFGFLGREKEAKEVREADRAPKEEDEHAKGIRKSLQRVLGIGHSHHSHHDEGKGGGGQDVASPTSPAAKI